MRATHLPTAARHCSSEIGMSPTQTEEEDKVERGHPQFVNPVTDSTNQLGEQEGKLPSIRGSTVWETFTGTIRTHHSCVQGTGTGSGCTEWGNDGHKVRRTDYNYSESFPRLIVLIPLGGWAHFKRERTHGLTTTHVQVNVVSWPVVILRAASSRHVKLTDNGTVTSVQLEVEPYNTTFLTRIIQLQLTSVQLR